METKASSDLPSVQLVDPERLTRTALALALNSSGTMTVVADVDDAESALEFLDTSPPPVIILTELSLPCRSGIEFLKELRARALPTKTIILSRHVLPHLVEAALDAGASGYLSKEITFSYLLSTLHSVLTTTSHHTRILSPDIERVLKEAVITFRSRNGSLADPLRPLSKREREIFFHLISGEQNAKIARDLHISPRTVETHRARIVRKLGVKTNGELIRFAIRNEVSAA